MRNDSTVDLELTVSWSLTKVVVSCVLPHRGRVLLRQVFCCYRSEAVEQSSSWSATSWH